MSFAQRVTLAKPIEEMVFNSLRDWGYAVAKNGTEHTHPEFIAGIKTSTDVTSLSIRFAPDGVISFGEIPHSAYVEIKSGRFRDFLAIERAAYENYMRLANDGCLVVIVFGCGDETRFTPIECLALLPAKSAKWPIVDGWISPRDHKDWPQVAWAIDFKGSGTPHRYIDFDSMTPWDEFPSFISEITGSSTSGAWL